MPLFFWSSLVVPAVAVCVWWENHHHRPPNSTASSPSSDGVGRSSSQLLWLGKRVRSVETWLGKDGGWPTGGHAAAAGGLYYLFTVAWTILSLLRTGAFLSEVPNRAGWGLMNGKERNERKMIATTCWIYWIRLIKQCDSAQMKFNLKGMHPVCAIYMLIRGIFFQWTCGFHSDKYLSIISEGGVIIENNDCIYN